MASFFFCSSPSAFRSPCLSLFLAGKEKLEASEWGALRLSPLLFVRGLKKKRSGANARGKRGEQVQWTLRVVEKEKRTPSEDNLFDPRPQLSQLGREISSSSPFLGSSCAFFLLPFNNTHADPADPARDAREREEKEGVIIKAECC